VAVFTQFGTDVLVNFDRPSLVQTLSLTAALAMHPLNACRSAGGTMFPRQLTRSLRPDEESSPLIPVFWRQAVASSFALATADDEAMGVDADAVLPVKLVLLLLVLLQPATARIPSVAKTARTCRFPDIANPLIEQWLAQRPARGPLRDPTSAKLQAL
jgi:hypothetical protein